MLIEHKIGEPFQNLSQRMLYTWAATFPGFVPVESAQADGQSQRELHGFLARVIRGAYDDPALLGLPAEVAGDGFLVRRGAMRLAGKNLPLLAGFGLRAYPCDVESIHRLMAFAQEKLA